MSKPRPFSFTERPLRTYTHCTITTACTLYSNAFYSSKLQLDYIIQKNHSSDVSNIGADDKERNGALTAALTCHIYQTLVRDIN